MALTATEQRLFDWAKAQLPEWFVHGEREEEFLAAAAKQHGIALELAQNWLGQTMILVAVGPTGGDADWLNMHAGERNTSRQDPEGDPALRQRIRNVEDAITPPILLKAAQDIVDAEGIVGTVAMVEMPAQGAYTRLLVADTGVGGEFSLDAPFAQFKPDTKPKAPWLLSGDTLVLAGSLTPANDGSYSISSSSPLAGDNIRYTNGGAVPEVDPGVSWTHYKKNKVTPFEVVDEFQSSFASRGYRTVTRKPTIIMILPFGCTDSTSVSVLEMLRQKKGGGVVGLVECRTIP